MTDVTSWVRQATSPSMMFRPSMHALHEPDSCPIDARSPLRPSRANTRLTRATSRVTASPRIQQAVQRPGRLADDVFRLLGG